MSCTLGVTEVRSRSLVAPLTTCLQERAHEPANRLPLRTAAPTVRLPKLNFAVYTRPGTGRTRLRSAERDTKAVIDGLTSCCTDGPERHRSIISAGGGVSRPRRYACIVRTVAANDIMFKANQCIVVTGRNCTTYLVRPGRRLCGLCDAFYAARLRGPGEQASCLGDALPLRHARDAGRGIKQTMVSLLERWE